MQVLVPVPRELELDRIELKQKVISECAHQGEARVVRVRNSSINVRSMEKAEGCLLRSSSGKSFGSGFSRPFKAEPRHPNSSQCGCCSKSGWMILASASPRALSDRQSNSRPAAAISISAHMR